MMIMMIYDNDDSDDSHDIYDDIYDDIDGQLGLGTLNI